MLVGGTGIIGMHPAAFAGTCIADQRRTADCAVSNAGQWELPDARQLAPMMGIFRDALLYGIEKFLC